MLTRTVSVQWMVLVLIWTGRTTCVRGDDSPKAGPEPALVITLAGVDRVLDDVDDLLRSGDAPGYAEFVRGFVAGLNDLQGFDRERPLAVMLFFDPANPDAKPAPLIGIPVTDIKLLQATIATTGNELKATDDPRRYQLRLGKDNLELSLLGGYGFVTNPKQTPPPDSAQAALDWLEAADSQPDIAVHFRRAGIPVASIDKLRHDLQRAAEREQQPRDGESDEEFRLRTDLQRGIFELLDLILAEGQELHGVLSLQKDAPLSASVHFRAQPHAALSDWIHEVMAEPRRLELARNLPFALHFQSAFSLTGSGRELARRLASLARRGMLRQIGTNAPVDLVEQINRAFDSLDATASAGRAETRLDFLPTPTGRFVLLTGIAASQPEAIDGAFRAALPLAAGAGDLPAVTFDALRLRGLNFHEIPDMPVRERDRKLYGANPALLIAAGREAVWVAVGGPETPQVLSAAFQPEETEEPPPVAALLTVRLLPWAELAALEGGQRERTIADVARNTLQLDSAVTTELRPTEDGLRLTFTAGDECVALFAKLAVLRARNR